MAKFSCLLIISLLSLSGVLVNGRYMNSVGDDPYSQLRNNYYSSSCKDAESVIEKAVSTELDKNSRFAAGLIRMAYHDCFVEGCDASILLDGDGTEKTARMNSQLKGFDVIDVAKAAVEEICPGVVSCADIIQYAARDSAVKLSGPSWEVQGGRKDGFVSKAERAQSELPGQDSDSSQLIDAFGRRRLSARQMVVLSGSHTVGVGHCDKFVGRLYDFSPSHFTDPTIDPAYAEQLKADCPQKTWNTSIDVVMDVITPGEFDSNYYNTLKQQKGLFTSDQSLFEDSRTKSFVTALASGGRFQTEFGQAMRALGAVGVKTQGQIRKNCRVVNRE